MRIATRLQIILNERYSTEAQARWIADAAIRPGNEHQCGASTGIYLVPFRLRAGRLDHLNTIDIFDGVPTL